MQEMFANKLQAKWEKKICPQIQNAVVYYYIFFNRTSQEGSKHLKPSFQPAGKVNNLEDKLRSNI